MSGGEPLLRADLYEIIQYAAEKGLMPVLGTNGTLLDDAVVKKLKESGIKGLGISLDACNSEYHDLFRASKGAFEKTLSGIRTAVAHGIRVQINTTITNENWAQFDDILKLSEEIGASALHPFFLVEAGRGSEIESKKLDDQQYLDALKYIVEKQAHTKLELKPTCAPQYLSIAKALDIHMRYTRGCIAGISYCCILPDGKVNVCPYMPIEAGDLRVNRFDDIWFNSEVFTNLRDREKYSGSCAKCSDFDICGGCRARAYYKSGDYLAQDPLYQKCFKADVTHE